MSALHEKNSISEDERVNNAIRIEVQRQLQVIEGEKAILQYFQSPLVGIIYSSFVRFVFKMDEYLKGTRDALNVGLWYMIVICFSIIATLVVQTYFVREPAFIRYVTAFRTICALLQYIVQIYFMLFVGLITAKIDTAANDIDWVTLEISTVAICITLGMMLSSALSNLSQSPSVENIKSKDHTTELVNEIINEMASKK